MKRKKKEFTIIHLLFHKDFIHSVIPGHSNLHSFSEAETFSAWSVTLHVAVNMPVVLKIVVDMFVSKICLDSLMGHCSYRLVLGTSVSPIFTS